jgi:imidazolonepropionase-like amidohydrolase
VRIPAGAEVRDVSGKVIMPGLVDTHSHIGGGDGGDRSGPLHGDVRILDALNARDDGIRKARAGGLTTVNIMPGSGPADERPDGVRQAARGAHDLRHALLR